MAKKESYNEMLENLEGILSTLENDEFNYSINEVVEVCHELSIPAVFDIHHQRVYNNKFGLSHDTLEEEFLLARETWKGRKWQRLHISSPKNGFENIKDSRAHSDFIDVQHLPKFLFSYDNLIKYLFERYPY